MLDNYYQILEVAPGSSKQDIKKAYWKMAKKWHPDINPDEEAQSKFIQINEAYEVLVNGKVIANNSVFFTEAEYAAFFDTHYSYAKQPVESPQERAARFARIQYEEFKRNNEIFKSSLMYVPAKIIAFLIWIIGNILGVCALCLPLLIVWLLGWLAAVAIFPFALLGLFIIAASFRFKQDVERYF